MFFCDFQFLLNYDHHLVPPDEVSHGLERFGVLRQIRRGYGIKDLAENRHQKKRGTDN
jgi:hypothetical protein